MSPTNTDPEAWRRAARDGWITEPVNFRPEQQMATKDLEYWEPFPFVDAGDLEPLEVVGSVVRPAGYYDPCGECPAGTCDRCYWCR